MQFSKITLFSLIALATALPNAAPEPEPAQLEARTFNWNWLNNKCHCDCHEGNYKRDAEGLETRTLWLLPNLGQKSCEKQCKKKCDDYYDEQLKICKKEAWNTYDHCKYRCEHPHKRSPTNNNQPSCKDKCKKEYDDAIEYCKHKYSH